MAIPLLEIKPSSQNHRVPGYDVPNEDTPLIYRSEDLTDSNSTEELIWAAYRQIFSEHVILESSRQTFLESQFKNRQISVRDFIRGLGKSETFYRLIVEPNSNYRIVEIALKRFLGRTPYNEGEKITWSIAIANTGIGGFIDALVDSAEYLQSFGENTVPYQRRRLKDRPFNLVTPRYGNDWRLKQEKEYPKQGDIRNFLSLAREITIKQVIPKPVSTAKIAIPDSTRKSNDPSPASIRGSFRFPVK
ncbi:Phycobilisome Linker polypeptide [Synechococcus sp. PCC 7502]|uniref:phycobilisome rod-core linker polypeptide n=1 Tax=Synechococcus sp. PCC 7502 TaxID=1173263 RepID=UPI00029FF6BB|nr:phycobilisome rod-core linker polypeptide [Synechococcus sp. PCC 7502]AFY75168.1 Phycobilisome Linker polypeptide [Synechococcus sp. PCC 7502]